MKTCMSADALHTSSVISGSDAVRIIGDLELSQAAGARLLGVSANTVTSWGNGGSVRKSTQRLLQLLILRPELVHVLKDIS